MIAALALLASFQQQPPPVKPDTAYLLFVASEGFDQVALVRFGAAGAHIAHRTLIRLMAADSVGPRGIDVAPDGRVYYVSTARGFPHGELLRFRIAGDSSRWIHDGTDSTRGGPPPDTLGAREPLGRFPDAVQVTPDGDYAWVVNATPDDDPAPSFVSVVYLGPMVEVARIATCAAPRGGRLSADGAHFYTACRHDDELLDIDARAMAVTRRLALTVPGSPPCGPNAVGSARDGALLYVVCETSGEVVIVNGRAWSVTRRIPVGAGPRDVAISRDGAVAVVTRVGSRNIALIDAAAGTVVATVPAVLAFPSTVSISVHDPGAAISIAMELGRLATRRPAPAHVAISPDGRYAFVTVDAADEETGALQVIDLAAHATVATVEVGRGARGLDFWKMDAAKSRP